MRWVQQAALRPHRCAAVPFIGNATAGEGFIDTGHDLPGWDPHVYVSVTAVKEMARMIGWAPRQGTDPRVADLQARVAELEQQIAGDERLVAAATTLMEANRLAEVT